MDLVMAHSSFPWQDEALSVAMHKPNVWIDLSGWSQKYFPKQLVQYANTLLKDRILFGSDAVPAATPLVSEGPAIITATSIAAAGGRSRRECHGHSA